jgi:hypothetical protein
LFWEVIATYQALHISILALEFARRHPERVIGADPGLLPSRRRVGLAVVAGLVVLIANAGGGSGGIY